MRAASLNNNEMKLAELSMQSKLRDKQIKDKVEKLLSRMTLAQKIGQMTQVERLNCSPEQVKKYHIGSILSGAGSVPGENTPKDWIAMSEAYWQASMEKDEKHLAIPILYGIDAIHGHSNLKSATIFPHNIGLGAANDPDLLEKIARITAKEILATGIDWTFAPNLAVARDNHWGRTYESFSEDPEIIKNYASKIVTGLQNNLNKEAVIACVKHFVGDGGTSHGVDQGNTQLTKDILDNIHIAPYYSALDAGVLTVMASFSSWNGKKCHANKWLLTDKLKKAMGFNGFIISDMEGIDYLSDDFYQAVKQGVNSGIDMFMMPESWQLFIEHLQHHVELGSVSINRINNAVRRILTVKFAYGLFDAPSPKNRPLANKNILGCDTHRKIAREAVRKSLVLLKNNKKCLPLDKNTRILVAGKSANNLANQCGGFTIDWQGFDTNNELLGATSIWQAINEKANNCMLSTAPQGLDADKNKHDVAIVVIGEKPYAEGLGDIREGNNVIVETGSLIQGKLNVLAPYGSSLALADLHPEDLKTITNITNKGIPVVTILVSGRTLIINEELTQSSAFIAAWLPGSEGDGVADMLFGEHQFQGKLSFTWPNSTHPTMNKGDSPYEALFPYGFGLTI